MKKIFTFCALAFAAPAFAAPVPFAGEFVAPRHKVTYKDGYDIFSCTEEGGEFMEARGCVFNGQNNISVVRNGAQWFARVSTITANASLCDFEGEAKAVAANVLLASAEGEQFVPGRTSGAGEWVPATCEVLITYHPDGSVTAKERDFRKCASFCGATGLLEIKKALRKQ